MLEKVYRGRKWVVSSFSGLGGDTGPYTKLKSVVLPYKIVEMVYVVVVEMPAALAVR